MRWLTLILVALIALLQYSLWIGKGSWLRVWEVSQQLETQKQQNLSFKARNESLDAEVRDLKQGYDAIEERARSELGMIKQDEVFFQVLEDPTKAPAPAAASGVTPGNPPVAPAAPGSAGTLKETAPKQ